MFNGEPFATDGNGMSYLRRWTAWIGIDGDEFDKVHKADDISGREFPRH